MIEIEEILTSTYWEGVLQELEKYDGNNDEKIKKYYNRSRAAVTYLRDHVEFISVPTIILPDEILDLVINAIKTLASSSDIADKIMRVSRLYCETISKISPFIMAPVINPTDSARKAGAAMRAYREGIESASAEIAAHKMQIIEDKADIERNHDAVNGFYEKLFTGENALKNAIDNIKTDIDDVKTKIDQSYDELYENDDSIMEQIDAAKEESHETVAQIKKELQDAENQLSELAKAYTQVFGQINNDQEAENFGEREGGLLKEIEIRKRNFNQLQLASKDEYEKLFKKIEGLLPGATSAGLAESYERLETEARSDIRKYELYYLAGLIVLVIAAGTLFLGQGVRAIGDNFWPNFMSLEQAMLAFVNRSPLFLPAFLLIGFASRGIRQAKRLKEEYAHKKALAKTFVGFKNQVKEDDSTEMRDKLTHLTLDAVGFNAASTLEKKKNDAFLSKKLSSKPQQQQRQAQDYEQTSSEQEE